jgi:hypothetical protein
MKKYKIEIQARAKVDIKEAEYYYEKLSPGLGKRFIMQLRDISKTLKLGCSRNL